MTFDDNLRQLHGEAMVAIADGSTFDYEQVLDAYLEIVLEFPRAAAAYGAADDPALLRGFDLIDRSPLVMIGNQLLAEFRQAVQS